MSDSASPSIADHWYLAVGGSKWHKAVHFNRDLWRILSVCSRTIQVCVGIQRQGKHVPPGQMCSHCARNRAIGQ